jgi:putative inorganic carbon (HCO3(-)) transporter
LIYNFGLEGYLGLALYLSGVVAVVLSIVWRPIIGIYYLVPLIPLQTTRYRMMEFPLGASIVNVVLAGVAIGLLRKREWFLPRTPWTCVVAVYAVYTFLTLFLDGNNLVPRFREWWNYMSMPLLLFLVAASVKTGREMKIVLLLMCLATLAMDRSFWNAIKDRDYSTFSRDLQEGGAMGYAGVQGMAAYNAQFAWLAAALSAAQDRRIVRLALFGLALFAANCVMYSFSRGGYVALLAGWLFMGVVKWRKLLVILLLFGATWTAVVPNAVRERVLTTYDPNGGELDRSSTLRLELWSDALDLFQANPVTGSGFNTYAYMNRLYGYADTHNIYLKVLIETGLIGLLLLLWLMAKTFWTGCRVFRYARDPLFSALGLGLAAWVVCSGIASLFGDRWTYLQINGYLWVLAGLVTRAAVLESEEPERGTEAERVESPELLEASQTI